MSTPAGTHDVLRERCETAEKTCDVLRMDSPVLCELYLAAQAQIRDLEAKAEKARVG
jgi:hypothetical protein